MYQRFFHTEIALNHCFAQSQDNQLSLLFFHEKALSLCGHNRKIQC